MNGQWCVSALKTGERSVFWSCSGYHQVTMACAVSSLVALHVGCMDCLLLCKHCEYWRFASIVSIGGLFQCVELMHGMQAEM